MRTPITITPIFHTASRFALNSVAPYPSLQILLPIMLDIPIKRIDSNSEPALTSQSLIFIFYLFLLPNNPYKTSTTETGNIITTIGIVMYLITRVKIRSWLVVSLWKVFLIIRAISSAPNTVTIGIIKIKIPIFI
jgi:hypothetical protein